MSYKNIAHYTTQCIAMGLFFGIAGMAGADQVMMRAQPAPTPVPSMVVAPVGAPTIAKPPNPNTQMPLNKFAPSSQNGGMVLLNPTAACNLNNTPRITNINGRQSGIEFKPGDLLKITGCGFGKGGQVVLGDVGWLIIDGWDDANIQAHIDPGLRGVPDRGGVKLQVRPNGSPILFSNSVHSFRAAREDVPAALSSFNPLNIYADIYGTTKVSSTAASINVSRHLDVKSGFCPKVTNQESQLWDFFPYKPSLASGFEAIVTYTNETDQSTWDNQKEQMVLVGDGGSAKYDAVNKGVKVFFQGHSTYTKKILLSGGQSTCTSSYTISMKLRGPRGMSPTSDVGQLK